LGLITELHKAPKEDTRAEQAPEANDEERRQRILRQKMRVHPRPLKRREENKDAAAA
jgi:hypothetical protein